MTILYLHRTQGRGAEGLHIASMILEWKKAGHPVDVFSPPGIDPMATAGERPVDKSDCRSAGIGAIWKWVSNRFPQWAFELAEMAYNIYSLPCLLWGVLKNRPRAIYERYAFFHFSGALVSRLAAIPLFIEVNEVAGLKRARGQYFNRVCMFVERRIFAQAERLFAVSSYLKDRIQDRCPGAEVLVVPNGANPALLETSRRRDEIRRRYGLEGTMVLGFAGWFDEWDRIELLLRAYGRLRARYERLSALIIGDGKNRLGLEDEAKALGLGRGVTFTGPVTRRDIWDYLDAVDIAVLPHSNDFGSPMVLFEFMALGKPLVAPSVAPIRDVISDGENGLLFPPLDQDKLCAAVERLLADEPLRKGLGMRAREDVATRFNWTANAATVLKEMDKMP